MDSQHYTQPIHKCCGQRLRNPSKKNRSGPDRTWRSFFEPARTVEASHSATARHFVAAPGFWNIVTPTQNAESKRPLLSKRFEPSLWLGEPAMSETGSLSARCVMAVP